MSVQLENMVPEYYVDRSRDFQLLCRCLNIFLGASEENSKKIITNWSVDTLDESLLPLMARKLGFLADSYIPPKILRNICKAYPHIIKYKGTLQAVREAAYAVFSAYQEVYSLNVSLSSDATTPYNLVITSNASQGDEQYLDLILPFIVPAGMTWSYVLGLSNRPQYISSVTPEVYITRLRGYGIAISKVMRGAGKEKPSTETKDWTENFNSTDEKSIEQYSRVGFAQISSKVTNGFIVLDKELTD